MYKHTNNTSITRLTDNASIPADEGNRDYQEYLRWLAEGNEPEVYVVPPTPIPTVVTMRQARLALFGAGLLTMVESAIQALPEPQKTAARIEWEYAHEVHRNSVFVSTLGGALGLTEEQLDGLFTVGATL